MDQKNKLWIAIGAAVLVIIIIAALLAARSGNKQNGTNGVNQPKPIYGIKTDAPAGTVVKSMPDQLIIDKEATVVSSYQTSYESGNVLAVAQFTSTDSIQKIYNDYLSLLKSGKYDITNSKASASLGTINAVNVASEVSVQITKSNGKSNVVVN